MNERETIAIITALPVEARSLTPHKLAIGQTIWLSSHFMLHVAGMGARRAHAAALRAIGLGATGLVSWGSAGGLEPKTLPGALFLPVHIIDQNGRLFPADAAWRQQLQFSLGSLLNIHEGTLLQVDEVVTSLAGKRALSHYGAAAIDMESAAIAAIARQEGMRFIAVRSLVDAADAVIPKWLSASLNDAGEIKSWKLVNKICQNPSRMMELVRLARAFDVAKASLQIAARYITQNLPPRDRQEEAVGPPLPKEVAA